MPKPGPAILAGAFCRRYSSSRADAKHMRTPQTRFEKLVNFRIRWPNRFENLTADRSRIERTFSMMKDRFGRKTRCRTRLGKIEG